jgi:HAMP domain-containing protein
MDRPDFPSTDPATATGSPPPPLVRSKTVITLGLRGRLILMIVVAFATIFAMIVQHTVAHRNEEITNATTHLLHSAELIALKQHAIITHANAVLNDLMLRRELHPDTVTTECAQLLAARAKQAPEFSQIGKVLPNGDIACTAVPASGKINVADREWFQRVLESEGMIISNVLTGRILNKKIIAFARAMRDDAGKVSGVFYLALDLDWLRHELAQNEQSDSTHLVVVDSTGEMIIHSHTPDVHERRNIAHTPLFETISAYDEGEGTLEEMGLDGVPRIYAFAPLLNTISGPITLWLSVPKAMVVAATQRELVTSLSIATTVLLLLIALVLWGSEKLIFYPLRRLLRAVEHFGGGDLGARTGLSYGADDIGRLAHAFDTMAGSVQDGEQQLARANHALRVLSSGNRILLSCKTEQELTQEMCRAIVEVGGYQLAWIGFVGDDQLVQAVASWGTPDDFFDGLQISCDETEAGRGPTGTAIRQGIPVASNNTLNDPDYAPWRERAKRFGYAASLALPLRVHGSAIGALNIYAAEPGAFDAEVI